MHTVKRAIIMAGGRNWKANAACYIQNTKTAYKS